MTAPVHVASATADTPGSGSAAVVRAAMSGLGSAASSLPVRTLLMSSTT